MILYAEYRNVDELNKVVKKYGFVALIEKDRNSMVYSGKEIHSDKVDEALVCLFDGLTPDGWHYYIHSFAVLQDNEFKEVKLSKGQREYLHKMGVKLWEFPM